MASSEQSSGISIDPYSVSTVPMEMLFNDQFLALGTAFVWNEGDAFWLVTNWHNLTGINPQTGEHISNTAAEPNQIRVWLNAKDKLGQKVAIKLPLLDTNGGPLWWVHPTESNNVDVVALPLDVPANVEPYPINQMENRPLAPNIGMDLFVLGYPFGIGPAGLPVWKRASAASEPQFQTSDRLYMLVDTASRPGMSGSPVIRRTWGTALLENGDTEMGPGFYTRFVGIYSGRIQAADPIDASLGMVWPERFVSEIIAGQQTDTQGA